MKNTLGTRDEKITEQKNKQWKLPTEGKSNKIRPEYQRAKGQCQLIRHGCNQNPGRMASGEQQMNFFKVEENQEATETQQTPNSKKKINTRPYDREIVLREVEREI